MIQPTNLLPLHGYSVKTSRDEGFTEIRAFKTSGKISEYEYISSRRKGEPIQDL